MVVLSDLGTHLASIKEFLMFIDVVDVVVECQRLVLALEQLVTSL